MQAYWLVDDYDERLIVGVTSILQLKAVFVDELYRPTLIMCFLTELVPHPRSIDHYMNLDNFEMDNPHQTFPKVCYLLQI